MNDWPYTGNMPEPQVPQNLYQVPDSLTVGDSILWYAVLQNQPAAQGWVLTYFLRNGNGSNYSITTPIGADGLTFKVTQDNTYTANWIPGFYKIQGRAVNAGLSLSVPMFDGFIEVRARLQVTDPGQDVRSYWRQVRDNCRDVLLAKASDDILESTIEGTMFRKMDYNQLLALHDRAEQNVRNEEAQSRASQGEATGRTIYASFTRPI